MTAAGASGMSQPDATDEIRTKDKKLVTVGMVALLISWVLITLVAVTSFFARPSTRAAAAHSDIKQGNRLLYAVLFALPFLGIRVVVGLVYFATLNQDLSPVSGTLGYKVGLGFIEELLISLAYVTVGIVTRNVGKEGATTRRPQKVSTEEAAWGSRR
jgi:heme/copper-type cytochrome/quinol oxidase subunit 2